MSPPQHARMVKHHSIAKHPWIAKHTGRWEGPAIACLLAAEALALTVLGIPLAALAWVAGLVLLTRTTRWTPAHRIRAALVAGTGFPLVLAGLAAVMVNATTHDERLAACRDGGACATERPWLALLLAVVAIAYAVTQVVVCRRLLAAVGEHGPRAKGLR